MTIRVTPGPVGSSATRARAEALQRLRASQLERIRAAADKWRLGLVGVLALITTVSVVKGRDTIADLSTEFQIGVGAALLAALITASFGSYRGMRAAFGTPTLQRLRGDANELLDWERTAGVRAMRDLRWAVICTYLTLALIALSVGLTWFAPVSPPANIKVTTNAGQTVCGTLMSGDAQGIVVKYDGQKVTFPTGQLRAISIKSSC